MIRYRQFMKVRVAKHCRIWSPLPGPGKECNTMEWQDCSTAAKLFPSSFVRKA